MFRPRGAARRPHRADLVDEGLNAVGADIGDGHAAERRRYVVAPQLLQIGPGAQPCGRRGGVPRPNPREGDAPDPGGLAFGDHVVAGGDHPVQPQRSATGLADAERAEFAEHEPFGACH